MRIDLFASNVDFKENGGDSFGSVIGSVTSLIIVLLVTMFGIEKFMIVINHQDTNHNEYVVKRALTKDVIGQD